MASQFICSVGKATMYLRISSRLLLKKKCSDRFRGGLRAAPPSMMLKGIQNNDLSVIAMLYKIKQPIPSEGFHPPCPLFRQNQFKQSLI